MDFDKMNMIETLRRLLTPLQNQIDELRERLDNLAVPKASCTVFQKVSLSGDPEAKHEELITGA